MKIPASFALIAPIFFACSAATAQDYRTWTKLDIGSVYWYVDEDSVSKVANTIFFDGYMNRYPDLPYMESAARTGIACDGSVFQVTAAPWEVDSPETSSDLARSLDLRRSIELNSNITKIDRNSRTSSFRARLATLCKSTKRPEKNLQVVIASSVKGERTIARLNTFTRPNVNQIEVWTDSTDVQKFQPAVFRDGEWKPALNTDGSAQYSEELKPSRSSASKFRYDCEQRKQVALTLIRYSPDGSVTTSTSLRPTDIASSWNEVIPETVGEAALEFLCGL